jgi:hypothetical protein
MGFGHGASPLPTEDIDTTFRVVIRVELPYRYERTAGGIGAEVSSAPIALRI